MTKNLSIRTKLLGLPTSIALLRVATACLGINFCDSKYSVTISLALEAAIKC